FVFPDARVQNLEFVMRDCPIDIDIIYLDGAGRVLSFYEMKAEKPRQAGEGQAGDMRNDAYEGRLKKYPSGYPAAFAIELKAGSIRAIGVKAGEKVQFDAQGLKKIAK